MRPLRAAPNQLLTTQALHDRHYSTKDIEKLVRWGWLIRLHRGVYLVPAPDLLARAALVAAGEGALLTMESSLAHVDLRPRPPGPIHVNVPRTGGPTARDGRIRIHRARIPQADVTQVRGLPTTTPTRALLDVAARMPDYALLRAFEQAERLPVSVDRARLEACPALARPLALFDHYGPCTRSDAEAMFLVLCEDHGIARPLVNQIVGGHEADLHWPTAGLIVEVDGWEFHDGRRAFHRDRRRIGAFRRAGYEVVPFAAVDVEHDAAGTALTVLFARPQLAVSTFSRNRVREGGRKSTQISAA